MSGEIDDQNVEDVSRTACRDWASAGMKLPGNLIGKAQAANRRCHGDSEFRQALYMGIDKIDLSNLRGFDTGLQRRDLEQADTIRVERVKTANSGPVNIVPH